MCLYVYVLHIHIPTCVCTYVYMRVHIHICVLCIYVKHKSELVRIKFCTWQRLEGCLYNRELIKFRWLQNRHTGSLTYFLCSNNPKAIDPEESTTVVHQCILGNFRRTPGCKLCDGRVSSTAKTESHRVRIWSLGKSGQYKHSQNYVLLNKYMCICEYANKKKYLQ